MKTTLLMSSSLALLSSVWAFLPQAPQHYQPRRLVKLSAASSGNEVPLASRKDVLGNALRTLGLAGVSFGVMTSVSTSANAAAKPEYLKEPTEEFKALQERAKQFEQAAYEKKKEWQGKVAALEKCKTEPEIVSAIDTLTKFVLDERGLPVGIKKQAVVTDIRKIKRAGKEAKIWNKDAEISYEQLIYSINYQQSPNTTRDLANPL